MSKLIGDKNLNFLILNELSDYELGKVCQVNKYTKKLCDDETFWMNRIEKIFKLDSETKLKAKEFFEFDTWKELYIYLTEIFNFNIPFLHEFADDLKKYMSYKPEIDKLFDLITYPIWVKKQLYKKEEKRKQFWSYIFNKKLNKKEIIKIMSNNLFDFRDFEWKNKNVRDFIKTLKNE